MTVWGNGYYYFETPDYEDCFKKVWIVSKFSTVICTAYCGYDLLVDKVKSPRAPMPPSYVMGRLVRYNGTPLACMVSGAVSSSMISRARGNADDCWNYFLGYGIPSGIIWTSFYRTVRGGQEHSFKGAAMGFIFGCAAALIKKGHMHDWLVMPENTILGNLQANGPFGGDHWGDWRTPGTTYEDPGRRPQM